MVKLFILVHQSYVKQMFGNNVERFHLALTYMMSVIGTINKHTISEDRRISFHMGQYRVMRVDIVYNTPGFADWCSYKMV